MAAPWAPVPGAGHALRALLRRALPLLGVAMVLVATWVLALPSWHGWFQDDDYLNVRWVQEYRDDPLAALWAPHEVHGHVRPFSLVFHWLGAQLSNGDWWGMHAVLVGLSLGAVLATMALAARRHGGHAAWIAGLLSIPIGGLGLLLTWNAWIGSAGEIAFGIAAVALAHLAIARSSVLLALGVLVLGATSGLFKEPGWVAYPAAVATMAAAAWAQGRTRPAVAIVLFGMVAVGAAGFAWCWTPVNAMRLLEAGPSLDVRITQALQFYGLSIVDASPGSDASQGIAAPLVALALWRDLVPTRWLGRARPWVIGGLVVLTVVACVAYPGDVGAGLVAGLVLVLLRNFRSPQPELVLGLATVAIMMFNQGPDPVHALALGFGVAVWTAGHLVALAGEARASGLPTRAAGRVARATVTIALAALPLMSALYGILHAPAPQGNAPTRFGLTALSGLARLLHPESSELFDPEAAYCLAPMLGLRQGRSDGNDTVYIPGAARMTLPGDGAKKALHDRNVLPASLKGGTKGSVELRPATGFYVLGFAGAGLDGTGLELLARDTCGTTWTSTPPGAGDWASLTIVHASERCLPLVVELTGAGTAPADAALLAPLPPELYDLRGMPPVPRITDVRRTAG